MYGPLKYVILITSLLMVATISFLFSAVAGQSSNNSFVTYGKSIFGLSIKHPQDWEVKGYDRNVRDDRLGFDLFAIACPKSILEYPYKDKGYLTDFSECPDVKQVSIGATKLPINTTIEEFINFLDKGAKFSYMDYKLLEMNNTILSGLPAKKFVYSYLGEHNDENEIIKVFQIVTIYGNRAYTINYYSPILEFDDLMPTVQKMVESLKISPMPPCNFVKNENFTYGGKCVLSAPLS